MTRDCTEFGKEKPEKRKKGMQTSDNPTDTQREQKQQPAAAGWEPVGTCMHAHAQPEAEQSADTDSTEITGNYRTAHCAAPERAS